MTTEPAKPFDLWTLPAHDDAAAWVRIVQHIATQADATQVALSISGSAALPSATIHYVWPGDDPDDHED